MRAGNRLAWLSIAALGLWSLSMAQARASQIQTSVTYNTIGSVDGFGVTGTPVVSYQGVSNGSMTTGSAFNLGSFQISAPPAGTISTYLNIPFQILYKVESVGGAAPSPNDTPVVLTGFLEGKVSSTDGVTASPDLKVFFNSPVYTPDNYPPYPTTILPFQIGGLTGYLNVTSPGGNGQPIQANMIAAQSVPEPDTLGLFACLAALLAWKARRRPARVPSV
jgi:hypothetical protein